MASLPSPSLPKVSAPGAQPKHAAPHSLQSELIAPRSVAPLRPSQHAQLCGCRFACSPHALPAVPLTQPPLSASPSPSPNRSECCCAADAASPSGEEGAIEAKGIRLRGAPLYLDMQARNL